MLANGGQLDGRRVLGRKTIELMTVNHLPGGATLQDLALGGFGEAGFEGVGFGLGFAVGLGPAATAMVGSAGRVLLGRRRQHGLLGRPDRGPLRRLHDPALPVHRLPVPRPAAGAGVPSHRRLMSAGRGPRRCRPVAPVPSARPTPASSPASPGRPRSPACRRPTPCRSWDIAVAGIPFDGGTSYRPGARFGPAAVRQGSRLLRPYNPSLGALPFELAQVVDAGDIACTPFGPEEAVAQIQAGAEALLDGGGRLVAIGGDHTVALPLLRATARPGTARWPWCTSTRTSTRGTPTSASASPTAPPSGGPGKRACCCATTACTSACAGRSTRAPTWSTTPAWASRRSRPTTSPSGARPP